MAKIKNLEEAIKFLYKTIPLNKFPGDIVLKRTKEFLNLIKDIYNGNEILKYLDPINTKETCIAGANYGNNFATKNHNNSLKENKSKIIHIAGTCGKGSVGYFLSSLLVSQGFKVGLHLSPHLLDIRERVQINNNLISEKKFIKYLNELIPIIEKLKNSKYGIPSYFEILIMLALYSFDKEKVDYAIIETGLGGKYDASNIIEDKICILTKIGLDHTNILGNTIGEIANQKAAIIKKKNIVISTKQEEIVNEIFTKKADYEKANIYFIKSKKPKSLKSGIVFDFDFNNSKLDNIKLGMHGIHQAENCSLALAALQIISKRDNFEINKKEIIETLKKSNFKGRMEIIKSNDKIIIIDTAHNPLKMDLLIKSIKILYPNQKFNFLIAFKDIKDHKAMLKHIIEIANKIFITQFFNNNNFTNLSMDPKKIEKEILNLIRYKSDKHSISLEIINDNTEALNKATLSSNKLIITGSIYLISEVYNKLKLIN